MSTLIRAAIFLSAALSSNACLANDLFTLENMERERSAVITNMFSSTLTAPQRLNKLANQQRRLIDLERMVIRDERLILSDHIMVSNAFEKYDLTFLMHASGESQYMPVEHWLNQVNFTSAAISQGKVGER